MAFALRVYYVIQHIQFFTNSEIMYHSLVVREAVTYIHDT